MNFSITLMHSKSNNNQILQPISHNDIAKVKTPRLYFYLSISMEYYLLGYYLSTFLQNESLLEKKKRNKYKESFRIILIFPKLLMHFKWPSNSITHKPQCHTQTPKKIQRLNLSTIDQNWNSIIKEVKFLDWSFPVTLLQFK